MQFFPVYLNTAQKRIVVSGAGECALAKLRLLVRTQAEVLVFGADPVDGVQTLAAEGRIALSSRPMRAADVAGALLVYAANDAAAPDAAVAALARAAGVPVLIVDNLNDSDFITPAIVDRAPITVAIGTEGAAPVLARQIKADLEARLSPQLGALARIGKAFRPWVERLPHGRARRDFWTRFYTQDGPRAAAAGDSAIEQTLHRLLGQMLHDKPAPGHVHFVGAGPGDPELLTLRARTLLHEAEVVIHDATLPAAILELARREATLIALRAPHDIHDLLRTHGQGAQVVRLLPGAGTTGSFHAETQTLGAAGIAYSVVPGVAGPAARPALRVAS